MNLTYFNFFKSCIVKDKKYKFYVVFMYSFEISTLVREFSTLKFIEKLYKYCYNVILNKYF